MAKKTALNKREREKVKKALLERRAALMSDIDGTEQEIDEMQDPKADDLDRAVEAGAMELLVALGDTERRELEDVILALEKLENSSYGSLRGLYRFYSQITTRSFANCSLMYSLPRGRRAKQDSILHTTTASTFLRGRRR